MKDAGDDDPIAMKRSWSEDRLGDDKDDENQTYADEDHDDNE